MIKVLFRRPCHVIPCLIKMERGSICVCCFQFAMYVMRHMQVSCVAGHGQARDMAFLRRGAAGEVDGFDVFNSNSSVNTATTFNNDTARLAHYIFFLPKIIISSTTLSNTSTYKSVFILYKYDACFVPSLGLCVCTSLNVYSDLHYDFVAHKTKGTQLTKRDIPHP